MTTPQETPFLTTIRERAGADPGRPSVTVGDLTLSRAELVATSERVAERFAQLGVGRGSWVTIALPNSVEFVQAALATWLVGGTPQPVSHRLPASERAAIIELADPALVVGADAQDAGGRPAMSHDELRQAAAGAAPATRRGAVAAPAWKVVTSGGSTGRPKLIVATAPAISETVIPLGALLRVPEDGCVINTGPLSHNAPFVIMLAGLLLGDHVVIMERFNAAESLRLAAEHRAQWFYLVPTMMQRIWRLPEQERLRHDLSSVEVAFHMAAPCPRWLKRAWIDWLGAEKILELYGGTELQALTVIDGAAWLEHPGSVGRPVIGEIECRGPDGTPLPAGAEGELWMRRGPGAPAPYRYVGATVKSAADGWESLGDIGYLDADGYVYITDRDSDMILVGGANVYPAEIEAALDEHPAVRSSCAIGLPHEDMGNVVHVLVELAEETSDEELMAHLKERLVPYKLPRSIERVDAPLRDDAGKVRRSALRAERLARVG